MSQSLMKLLRNCISLFVLKNVENENLKTSEHLNISEKKNRKLLNISQKNCYCPTFYHNSDYGSLSAKKDAKNCKKKLQKIAKNTWHSRAPAPSEPQRKQ